MLHQGSRSLEAGHPSHIRWSRKFMLVWCCSSCCILVQMLQALTARLWWYRMFLIERYRGCRVVIDLAWSCCVCFRATQGRYGDSWMYSFRKDLAKSRKQWFLEIPCKLNLFEFPQMGFAWWHRDAFYLFAIIFHSQFHLVSCLLAWQKLWESPAVKNRTKTCQEIVPLSFLECWDLTR